MQSKPQSERKVLVLMDDDKPEVRARLTELLKSADFDVIFDKKSRKQTALPALENEEKGWQIVESLHEGIWAIDEDAVTSFVNQCMAEMLGYTPEEMIGRPMFSFMDDRGVEISKRNLERRQQGIKENHEFELLRKDGARVYTIMQTSPIMDADGKYVGALAGVLDITARKQTEDELRKAHDDLAQSIKERTTELANANTGLREEIEERKRVDGLFRQLLESAPDAMVIANHDGDIILVNAITEKLFGYSREELIGQPVEILVPQRFRKGHRGHREEYRGNPHVRPMGARLELHGVRKDGREFPAEVSLGPLQTDQGVLVFSAIRDITERKLSEKELRDSRERFDLAVRGTDAGVWDWDVSTDEVYYSPRWKSMLGYEESEIGNGFPEWEIRLHPDDRDRALATIKDYLAGKSKEFELEHRLHHRDGSYRWILSRGAAVYDRKGKPYRMVGSQIDITERKRVEEILRDQEAQLRAAQRIQEHLLPNEAPNLAGFDIAGASYPADFAAGDHFDYFTMADGSLGVVIGDVSGHGFSSALLMASTHAHMRSLAEMDVEIDEIFSRANSSLFKQTEAGNFVTASLVRLDQRSRGLTYVSAGHPAGLVIDSTGKLKTRLTSTSVPLAVSSDTHFRAGNPVTLEPNDIVILLTDGVLEAASAEDEFFGEERALQFVRANRTESAADIADGLCRAARDFCDRGKLQDDVTAVVIKVETDTPRE